MRYIFYPIIVVTFFLISGFAKAQEWQFSRSVEGIEVYYRIGECNQQPAIFLKVKSIRSEESTITWKGLITGRGVMNEAEERKVLISTTITIDPQSEIIPSCNDINTKELIILPKEAFKRYNLMKDFEFLEYRAAAIKFTSK